MDFLHHIYHTGPSQPIRNISGNTISINMRTCVYVFHVHCNHTFSGATVFIIRMIITPCAAGCKARSHQTRRRLPPAPTAGSTRSHSIHPSQHMRTDAHDPPQAAHGPWHLHPFSNQSGSQSPHWQPFLRAAQAPSANGAGSGGGGALSGGGVTCGARSRTELTLARCGGSGGGAFFGRGGGAFFGAGRVG